MNLNNKVLFKILTLVSVVGLLVSCSIKYSFSGASISPEVKTVSIAYFPNNAPMVNPTLSTTLVSALQDKFQRQTKLYLINEDGDFNFEGEITGYSSSTASVSGGEYAQLNRLTITVKVKFTNRFNEKQNFEKSFSQYAEYDSNKLLQEVEGALIPQIVDMLVEDIFNAAASDW